VRYAIKDGPRRRVILSDYPEVSLADARQKATELRLELLKGVDPFRSAPPPSFLLRRRTL